MDFSSFEEALKICLEAEEGSSEQVEAMLYCLEHAPPELQEMLQGKFSQPHGDNCGCGCSH